MTDIEVDAEAMQSDADTFGEAAATISGVRDGVNGTWSQGGTAFGSTPAAAAWDEFCSSWIGALNSIGMLVDALGEYTMDVANAFTETDRVMAGGMEPMYTEDDLPDDDEVIEYDPDAPIA